MNVLSVDAQNLRPAGNPTEVAAEWITSLEGSTKASDTALKKALKLRSASVIFAPTERDGHPLGHQSHGGADPRVVVSVAEPLEAEEIAQTLSVAWSNVSTTSRSWLAGAS
ncbi:MAG: hypothetical protein KatS3mg104_0220 [Phycisphaerae bacterium]|nr:MAG: hypothetical protein KatS3mg104_0220 [Phycisphaerae bacterium]